MSSPERDALAGYLDPLVDREYDEADRIINMLDKAGFAIVPKQRLVDNDAAAVADELILWESWDMFSWALDGQRVRVAVEGGELTLHGIWKNHGTSEAHGPMFDLLGEDGQMQTRTFVGNVCRLWIDEVTP